LKHAGVVDEDVNAAESSERSFDDALRFDIAAISPIAIPARAPD
jgi:hypothetical protein